MLSRDYRLFIMSWRCSLFLNNLCLYLYHHIFGASNLEKCLSRSRAFFGTSHKTSFGGIAV